eukprot:scaffold41951_cov37-Tisochrysis_lutea.AAC.3
MQPAPLEALRHRCDSPFGSCVPNAHLPPSVLGGGGVLSRVHAAMRIACACACVVLVESAR